MKMNISKTKRKTKPSTPITTKTEELFTSRATLCVIGVKLRSMKIFDIIGEHLVIKQKTIKHTPLEKITDAFISLLTGASGLCEINIDPRLDMALQRARGLCTWPSNPLFRKRFPHALEKT